jgi:aldose 1-epimerase
VSNPLPPSGEQFELSHGEQRAVVVEVGGGLRAYAVGGNDVLDGYSLEEMCSSGRGQILIPWPNRLRDGRYEWQGEQLQAPLSEPERGNAIHGFVRWANWTASERDQDRLAMELVSHPRDGYPFALELRLEYTLSDEGLTVTTSATNVGRQPCPFGVGAHPYITAGTPKIDECVLQAPGGAWMPTDDRMIPTGSNPVQGSEYDFREPRQLGETQLDTGYAELERGDDGRARVLLENPSSGRRVELWADESFPYLMLFTGDALPDESRRRRGLGVEPMSCAPNAFQSGEGLLTLDPGQSFTGSWGIQASS